MANPFVVPPIPQISYASVRLQEMSRHGVCRAIFEAAQAHVTLNGRMRDELRNGALFFGIDHAREAMTRRTHAYNAEPPDSALEDQARRYLSRHRRNRAKCNRRL